MPLLCGRSPRRATIGYISSGDGIKFDPTEVLGWSLGLDVGRMRLQGYLTYKKRTPLGPYRRPMPRVLPGS